MSRAGRGSSRRNVASRKDLVVRREREEEQESKAKRMRANETKEEAAQRMHSQNSQVIQEREAGKGRPRDGDV